jgi:hypothetical protein
MRRHIFNPGGDVTATITARSQGYVEIYVNGVDQSSGGPQSDCTRNPITAVQVLHHGDNVVVLYSIHEIGMSGTATIVLGGWIDVQVEAPGVTAVSRKSWAGLKLIYR